MALRLITNGHQFTSSSTQTETSVLNATVVASGIQALIAESTVGTSSTAQLPPLHDHISHCHQPPPPNPTITSPPFGSKKAKSAPVEGGEVESHPLPTRSV
ncbi:hypothetical protein ACFX13_026158 [Malus domestica]